MNPIQKQLVLELLWRATWQSAALAAIVWLVMLVARRRITPAWRVVLWTLPLCRLGILVVPSSNVSLYSSLDSFTQSPVMIMSYKAQSLQPEHLQRQGVESTQLDQVIDTDRAETVTGQVKFSSAAKATESPVRQAKASGNWLKSFEKSVGLSVLFWIWIAGCCVSLALFFVARLQLAMVIAGGRLLDREEVDARIYACCKSLGIRRRVRCVIVDAEFGPASSGILRPTLLIPRSLFNELRIDQLFAIVEHELHHIRRFDSGYLLLTRIASCLHWFNPLVYWLTARVRAEMELAVDAATVGQGDERSRISYGELLIQLSRRRSRSLGLATMAGRRSNLKSRIDELAAPTRNSWLRSFVCLAVVLLLMVTGLSDAANTQEGTAAPAAIALQVDSAASESRTFELMILATDGKAIPDAEIEIRGMPKAAPDWIIEGSLLKQGAYGMFVSPTKEGRLKLQLPNMAENSFSIKAKGYAPYWAEWKRVERPATFIAELDAGRIVGGIVVDEQGKPVVDAQVRPYVSYKKRPGDSSQLGVGANIKTDINGRWSYLNLSRTSDSFRVEIIHPQFKPHLAQLSATTFELAENELPRQTTTMSKGLSVTGKVMDSAGKPVSAALIRTKLFNDIRSANTNEEGIYELSGCEDGVARIVVSAPGLAVDMKQVHISENMKSVDFEMQPGGHVRIRVVDEKGQPVPKTVVFFQRWRDGAYDYFEFSHVNKYADNNGIWEWNEAPLDEFKADICRPGGMQLSQQALIARAEEYVFAPPPALVIVGRVVDSETKKPIENFQVVPGVRSNAQHMNWVPHMIFEGKNGSFEYREVQGYFAHLLKVQARGYSPVESRDIQSDEGRVEVTFELKRGADIDMRVMTNEGGLAVGAKVALGIPGAQINVKNGDIDDSSTYAQQTVTNFAGRFRFPGQSTAYQLIITHESGFAHFKSSEAEGIGPIYLTPWASAEGTFRVANSPVGGVSIDLNSGNVHSYGDGVPSIFTSCETVTAADGSFKFGRVLPGPGWIRRSILRMASEGAKEVTSSTSLSADFVAEQTTQIDFGLKGCPVVGKLIKPASYQQRVLWSFADIDIQRQVDRRPMPVPEELKNQPGEAQEWFFNWSKTEDGKAWAATEKASRLAPRYSATCDTEGQFKIDDMPAGTYRFSVRFYEVPPVGWLRDYVFTVSAKDASSGTTVDLGALQLKEGP